MWWQLNHLISSQFYDLEFQYKHIHIIDLSVQMNENDHTNSIFFNFAKMYLYVEMFLMNVQVFQYYYQES